MDNVKKAFAFALLAIGVWLIARILPLAWALTAWTLYAMFAAAYLYGDSKTRRFLAGPPAVLYYPPHGTLNAPKETLIGEMAPEAFAAKLRSWGN